jgi:NAD(P)H-dependent FMN reductase
MSTEILILVGSLRAASINRQLAELAAESAPDGVTLTIYEGLDELPFYNEDIDTPTPPPAVAALRAAAADADAALIVTPENNATIPAVLKNALDWLSRPWGAATSRTSRSPSSVQRPDGTAAPGRTTRPASR